MWGFVVEGDFVRGVDTSPPTLTHTPLPPPGCPQVVFSAYLDLTVPAAGTDLGRGVFECSSLPAGVMGVVYAWATGMGNLAMPPSVGLPVGTNLTAYSPSMYGVPYVVVQMHYSNAALAHGITDSSGVRVRVTDALQPIEAGTLWLGADVGAPFTVPTGKPACASGRAAQLACTCRCSMFPVLQSSPAPTLRPPHHISSPT